MEVRVEPKEDGCRETDVVSYDDKLIDDENLHGLSIQLNATLPSAMSSEPAAASSSTPPPPPQVEIVPPTPTAIDEEDGEGAAEVWHQQLAKDEEEYEVEVNVPHFDLIDKQQHSSGTGFVQQQPEIADTTAEDIDKIVEQVKNLNKPFAAAASSTANDPWEKINNAPLPPPQLPTDVPVDDGNEGVAAAAATYENGEADLDAIDAPGPCEPRDLIEGIIFSASYLGSTQLASKRNPGKHARMLQAQEAVTRIKAGDDEPQPSVEVDLFVSTDYVKLLNLQTQATMIEHALRSISYIADIGNLLVVMARRSKSKDESQDHKIVCHVLSSENAHLMAQAIGQAFNVAYQQFLVTNGIESRALSRDDYNKLLDDMYHDDLAHYTKNESIKEVWVSKRKSEPLGVVIVESGWGSIVPTVILANLQHGGPAEKSGKLSIGDQIISVNGTSLVGLPLATCQNIIKNLRSQTIACFKIVSCPPAVTVLIKRPHLQYQLGFSIQDGIICSLMRGGIAERGGVRVGHRIIEINGQSVVATDHDKIVKALVTSVGEIQMKTMPASMFRLLTGQETPIYI